jgi:hypothetical protein
MGATASGIRTLLLLSGCASLAGGALGANLTLEPGLWEASWIISNALTGQQVTETRTQCIRTGEFNPRELLRQAQGCRLLSEDQQGNRVRFSLECTVEGGATTQVDGDFESQGTSGSGKLRTRMRIGEMTLNLDTRVTTRRIGDCPTPDNS